MLKMQALSLFVNLKTNNAEKNWKDNSSNLILKLFKQKNCFLIKCTVMLTPANNQQKSALKYRFYFQMEID